MRGDGLHVELPELIALRADAAAMQAAAARRSGGSLTGSRSSPFRGRGMEYAESRPYSPGDDVRHIDWRVTARSGRVHSKLFQPERERITAIVLDTRSTMAFGTRGCFKSVQAARLAALLAWRALDDGDRICALCFGTRERLLPPAGGRRGVLRLLELLVEASALPFPDPPGLGAAAAVDRLARVLRPGSHVLLLLDPRSVDDALRLSLARLRAHHDLVAALLVDALEQGVPPPANYAVVGAGEPLRRLLALDQAPAREAWQQHFQQQQQHALDLLRRAGVAAAPVLTTDAPTAALARLLRGRPGRRTAA